MCLYPTKPARQTDTLQNETFLIQSAKSTHLKTAKEEDCNRRGSRSRRNVAPNMQKISGACCDKTKFVRYPTLTKKRYARIRVVIVIRINFFWHVLLRCFQPERLPVPAAEAAERPGVGAEVPVRGWRLKPPVRGSLREMLNEIDLPPRIMPVDGVLM